MSVAATVPGPAFSILSWIDRGLSSEAEALRKLTSAATEFSGSVTLGQPKRVARETLDAAYLSAREENWDGMGSARVEPTRTHTRVSSCGSYPPIWRPLV